MTREEFEKVYEESYQKALHAVRASGIRSTTVAEEAVSNAAMYFLERLDAIPRLTPSLFIQYVVRYAKKELEPRGVRHGSGLPPVEVSVGTIFDLAEITDGPDDADDAGDMYL